MQFKLLLSLACLLLANFRPFLGPGDAPCNFWVAPDGDDGNAGSFIQPWATIEHAANSIPDFGCIVWVKDGIYEGSHRITKRFTTFTWFKAINPYKAVFQSTGLTLSITGGSYIIMDGFVFQHRDSEASPIVVQVSRRDDVWAENIIFRNNIFRNSYNDDLLKIYNGARFVTVENNLFYNQGNAEQHMDVNSVTDITIQDNIFFNDFEASDRAQINTTKHYIVIKDSNEKEDGLLGAERILVQRNIFLNWQGGPGETFLQVGNDGKPYHEAEDVTIQNNLFLGNSPNPIVSAFGISGASNVRFVHNTISGDLPSRAYAARIVIKGLNPKNENILLRNNIWADPTGSMGSIGGDDPNEFADGDPSYTLGLVLKNNLYWNGGNKIPKGDLISPLTDDPDRIIADPGLDTDFSELILPVWNGSSFLDGSIQIRDEFLKIARKFGSLPGYSSAFRNGDPSCSPNEDLFRLFRGPFPSIGAEQG